jgi:hypothetical protein
MTDLPVTSQALIFNDQESLALPIAEKVLHMAQQGLPIVVVGQAPRSIPGLSPKGSLWKDEERVRAIFDEVLRLPTSAQVETADRVADALRKLQIR